MNEELRIALFAPGCLLGWPEIPLKPRLMEQLGGFVECQSDCCHKKAFITKDQEELRRLRRMPVICYLCACEAKDEIVIYAGGILGARNYDHPVTGRNHGEPVDLAALGPQMTKRRSIIDDMRADLKREIEAVVSPSTKVHICDKQAVLRLAKSSGGILTGAPVGFPGYEPREGFKPVKCEGCTCEMWAGPRMLGQRGENGWPFLCMVCVSLCGLNERPGVELKNLGG